MSVSPERVTKPRPFLKTAMRVGLVLAAGVTVVTSAEKEERDSERIKIIRWQRIRQIHRLLMKVAVDLCARDWR